MKDYHCEQLQGGKPCFLYGLNVYAWRIAFDTISLSNISERGIPSLSALEFVLTNSGYILSEYELSAILTEVQMIYNDYRSMLIAQINKANNG